MVKKLTVAENDLLAITNGESLDTITNQFGVAARLEFTAAEKNGVFTLVGCYTFEGENALWLVFRDGTLIKIIESFSFPELMETYPYQGTTASRIKSWDIDDPGIEERINKVVDAPALTHQEAVNDLKPYNGAGSEPLNILPALVLTGIGEKMTSQLEKDYDLNEKLLEDYNGCKANVGMSAEQVEKIYGKPLRILTAKNGTTARIYGYNESRELQVNPQLAFAGIAVVSDEKGRVTAIYGHVFFNEEWKRQR
jgi:hypothetical protein